MVYAEFDLLISLSQLSINLVKITGNILIVLLLYILLLIYLNYNILELCSLMNAGIL